MDNTTVKLIIAGGRDFDNYPLLRSSVFQYLTEKGISIDQLEIVLGCAPGADEQGEAFADEYYIPRALFPANWALHGNAAGPIRNAAMAARSTHCIVFWDGKSKGSRNMIRNARLHGLDLKIVMYGAESVKKNNR